MNYRVVFMANPNNNARLTANDKKRDVKKKKKKNFLNTHRNTEV